MLSLEKVQLESPFAAEDAQGVQKNIDYARRCMRDCFMRGEAPFASHLLYTQENVLDDNVPEERTMGIDGGLIWGKHAEKSVVYLDRGLSRGMKYGIRRAIDHGRPYVLRSHPDFQDDSRIVEALRREGLQVHLGELDAFLKAQAEEARVDVITYIEELLTTEEDDE